MWTIPLPLSVPVSGKSNFAINLNQYRNAHPMVLHKAKIVFAEIVGKRIQGANVPPLSRCTLEYVFYPGTDRKYDTNNVCTVADKFFSDTLVSEGKLEDDNYKFLLDTRFRFGAVDRADPRVDVIIRSTEIPPLAHEEPPTERKKVMKIITLVIISQTDVETAIRKSLVESEIIPAGATPDLTRAEDGSYELRIEQDTEKEKQRGGRRPKTPPTEAMAAVRASLPASTATSTPAAMPPVVKTPETTTVETGPAGRLTSPEESFAGASNPVREDVGPTDAATEQAATGESPAEGEGANTPPPPPPVKSGGLFSGFTRPKN